MGTKCTGEVALGSHSVAAEILRHRLDCSERESRPVGHHYVGVGLVGEIGNILDEVLEERLGIELWEA